MKRLRLWGIEVIINRYFLLLILAYLFLGVFLQALVVFLVVLFHEFVHARTALRYGLRVSQVEIYPFGGVARLEGLLAADPAREIKIALAGPLSNFCLVLGTLFLSRFIAFPSYWLVFFCNINLMLGIVNLLPALPLDGGRIARAILARRVGLKQATITVAHWGQALSVVLAMASIWTLFHGMASINGVVLAVFLFLAARQEGDLSTYLFLRYLTRKPAELRKRGMMHSGILVVTPETELGLIVEHLIPRRYHLVAVVGSDGKMLRLLTEGQIVEAVLSRGSSLPVSSIE